jgi:hypothetical protein
MPMAIAKGAALGLVLGGSITIMIFLMLLVVNQPSPTAACFAPHVMEQKPDSETSRPSPSRTELGIDI